MIINFFCIFFLQKLTSAKPPAAKFGYLKQAPLGTRSCCSFIICFYTFIFLKSHLWDLYLVPSVGSPPPSQRGCTVKSWPGDAVPSPAFCLLHQPGFPPAAAGSAGSGASRQKQVRPATCCATFCLIQSDRDASWFLIGQIAL